MNVYDVSIFMSYFLFKLKYVQQINGRAQAKNAEHEWAGNSVPRMRRPGVRQTLRSVLLWWMSWLLQAQHKTVRWNKYVYIFHCCNNSIFQMCCAATWSMCAKKVANASLMSRAEISVKHAVSPNASNRTCAGRVSDFPSTYTHTHKHTHSTRHTFTIYYTTYTQNATFDTPTKVCVWFYLLNYILLFTSCMAHGCFYYKNVGDDRNIGAGCFFLFSR